jgi:hypothetical protein
MADPKTIAAYQASRESKLRSLGVSGKPHIDRYEKASRLGHAPFYTSVGPPRDESQPQDLNESPPSSQRPAAGYPDDVSDRSWLRSDGEKLPHFDSEKHDRHTAHAAQKGAGARRR